MKKSPSVDSLLKLLTDEDDIARVAMVQLLLQFGHESDEIIRQLQECDDPLLRKRSHQMQAMLTFKQRRLNVSNVIHNRENIFSLSGILQEFHLVWFEQDSCTEIEELYRNLLTNYPIEKKPSFARLCKFMKEYQFCSLPDGTASANLYMLGTVLESKYGSNSFFAALMLAINEDLQLNLDLQVIIFEHRFYVHDRTSNMVCDISEHWNTKILDFSTYKLCSKRQLIKYMVSLCFCNAVNDDAFRYIQILGEILLPTGDTSTLPYPYSGTV